jgi:putative peptide zinc metalloprotease protein
LWGLVVRPVQNIVRFLNVPGRREEVKARHVVAAATISAILAAAVALIPLPQRVWCAAELRPRAEETVYVSVPGLLESVSVNPGDVVGAGDELARLSSIDLDLTIADLEGKATQARSRLSSLERERFSDPAAGLEIGTVEESLKSIEEQLSRKRKDRSDLVLTAPRGGVVLPATSTKSPGDGSGRLPGWSGQVLDERNLGASLAEGTVLCLVGDPAAFEAVMVVDQSEVEFVGRGQAVDLKIDALPWQTFRGTVDELAETSLETGSERLSVKAGGKVPTRTDESGRETPISTSYEALMALDDPDALLTPGMRGTARIRVGQRTVGSWLLRLLWQTFNFRM